MTGACSKVVVRNRLFNLSDRTECSSLLKSSLTREDSEAIFRDAPLFLTSSLQNLSILLKEKGMSMESIPSFLSSLASVDSSIAMKLTELLKSDTSLVNNIPLNGLKQHQKSTNDMPKIESSHLKGQHKKWKENWSPKKRNAKKEMAVNGKVMDDSNSLTLATGKTAGNVVISNASVCGSSKQHIVPFKISTTKRTRISVKPSSS